ncbi:reverse transcriptase domain-containing protein [Tanacetum coccineum]
MPSTAHGMLKFPVDGGIVTIRSTILIPAECLMKKRGQAPDRARAIQAEVQKLVGAGIIREIYYHDWMSNPVMDCYPLPEIDWKVESLCGYPFKCFLDAYKGYHQIQIAESDEEKTAFHTSQGVYCYTKMPFGLKNAGATYQRLVDKAFDNQVSRNIEVYVDDLVIKSYTEAEMLRDIEEMFRTLRKINMKLNPKNGPELNYTLMENLVLSLVFTSKRFRRAATKVEHHARRTQYNIPPKDIDERIDTSGLPHRKARRKPSRYTNYGNPTRAVDTIHRWIVMCRWIRHRVRDTDSWPSNSVTNGRAECATLRIYLNRFWLNTQRKIHTRGGSSNGDRGRGNNMDDPDYRVLERWDSPWRKKGGKQTPHKG